MLQNDSHLNCLCVMARLIEALAIYVVNLVSWIAILVSRSDPIYIQTVLYTTRLFNANSSISSFCTCGAKYCHSEAIKMKTFHWSNEIKPNLDIMNNFILKSTHKPLFP